MPRGELNVALFERTLGAERAVPVATAPPGRCFLPLVPSVENRLKFLLSRAAASRFTAAIATAESNPADKSQV